METQKKNDCMKCRNRGLQLCTWSCYDECHFKPIKIERIFRPNQWVSLHEDVTNLEDQIDALKAENEKLKKQIKEMQNCSNCVDSFMNLECGDCELDQDTGLKSKWRTA